MSSIIVVLEITEPFNLALLLCNLISRFYAINFNDRCTICKMLNVGTTVILDIDEVSIPIYNIGC